MTPFQLIERIVSPLGTSLNNYMPETKRQVLQEAQKITDERHELIAVLEAVANNPTEQNRILARDLIARTR